MLVGSPGDLDHPAHRRVLFAAAADVAIELVLSRGQVRKRLTALRLRRHPQVHAQSLDPELVPAAAIGVELAVGVDQAHGKRLPSRDADHLGCESGHGGYDLAHLAARGCRGWRTDSEDGP